MRLAALRSEVGLSGKHDKAVSRAPGVTKFSGVVPDQSVNTDFSHATYGVSRRLSAAPLMDIHERDNHLRAIPRVPLRSHGAVWARSCPKTIAP